nr:oligosaccharide flippase family protein [uncultured Pseudodesulfovibrio sp.]
MTSKLTKNYAHIAVSQGTIVLAKSLLLLILGRELGASGFGVYTLLFATPVLISTIATLGVSRAITFNLSGGDHGRETVLGNHAYLVCGIILMVTACQAVLFPLFHKTFFSILGRSEMNASLLIGAAFTLQIANNGVLHGVGGFHRLPLATVLQWSVNLGGIGFFWIQGALTPANAGFAYALGLAVFGCFTLLCPEMRGVFRLQRPDSTYFKSCFAYGSKASALTLTNTINLRLDYYIVAYFLPATDLGFYSLATSACEVFLNVFSRGLDFVLLPWAAKQSHGNRIEQTARLTRITFTLTLILAIGILMLAAPTVTFFFGQEYAPTVAALKLLLPGLIALSLSYTLTGILMGVNRLTPLLWAGIISFMATLILDIELIPRIGINGAAMASSVAYWIQTGIILVAVRRESGYSYSRYFFPGKNDFSMKDRRR